MACAELDRGPSAGQIEDLLICSICQHKLCDPKVLKCQHVFCGKCLKGWLLARGKKPKTIKCSVCRKVTKLPEKGIDGLPVNYTINSLLVKKIDSLGIKDATVGGSATTCKKKPTQRKPAASQDAKAAPAKKEKAKKEKPVAKPRKGKANSKPVLHEANNTEGSEEARTSTVCKVATIADREPLKDRNQNTPTAKNSETKRRTKRMQTPDSTSTESSYSEESSSTESSDGETSSDDSSGSCYCDCCCNSQTTSGTEGSSSEYDGSSADDSPVIECRAKGVKAQIFKKHGKNATVKVKHLK